MPIKTYPFCHIQSKQPWLTLQWVNDLHHCGVNLPMFIVHDLGHLLLYSKNTISIQAPDYLQNQSNTYTDTLNTICNNRIIQDIAHRTLSNTLITAIIAKLANKILFPNSSIIKNLLPPHNFYSRIRIRKYAKFLNCHISRDWKLKIPIILSFKGTGRA